MIRAAVFAITIAYVPSALSAEPPEPYFCLQTLNIHLQNGMPAEWRSWDFKPRQMVDGDLVPTGFIKSEVELIDGLPTPLVEVNASSSTSRTWRITAGRFLEPVPGLDPNFAISRDNVARDPSSGRVLALHHISGLYYFDDIADKFRRFDFFGQHLALYSIRAIPRLDMILVGTQKGLYRLDGNRLEPVSSTGPLDIGLISEIWDLPNHHGVALNRAFLGQHGSTVFRNDDGLARLLSQNSQVDRVSQLVFESTPAGRILLAGSNEVFDVEMGPVNAGWLPRSTDRVVNSSEYVFPSYLSTKNGETLVLSRPGRYWGHHGLERLDASGLHTAEGEAVEAPARPVPMVEMPGGAVLISGTDRYYRYRERNVVRIAGSEAQTIGPSSRAVVLTSIGKTLIIAPPAIFEVTPDARLDRLSLPFEFTNRDVVQIKDFTAAGRGMISIKDHLYSIDTSSKIQLVKNFEGQIKNFISIQGELPGQDALLVANGGFYQALGYRRTAAGCEPPN